MDAIILWGLDLWASANTPDALADAICKMNDARPHIRRDELAAQAAARFSWDVVFPKLFTHYREVAYA